MPAVAFPALTQKWYNMVVRVCGRGGELICWGSWPAAYHVGGLSTVIEL